MKTELLITHLAKELAPIQPHASRRRLALAIVVSLVCAFAPVLFVLGLRADLASAATAPMFWLKLAFPAAVGCAATWGVDRLGRPGARIDRIGTVLALPIAMVWTLAAVVLSHAGSDQRHALLLGDSWRVCTALIVALTVLPMACVLWAVKGLAPTRLVLAGSACGVMGSSVAAFAYALHCTEMQAPFVAIWYVLGMAISAALGALLGPRLLSW